MNIKAALKYRLYDTKKSIIIFYSVIITLLIFMSAASFFGLNGSANGIEITTAFFLFVLGLNSFKEVFRLFMQNGVSRKTTHVSQILITLIICSIMSLIDNILSLIDKSILTYSNVMSYRGLFQMIYGKDISNVGTFLTSILFCFCLYAVSLSLGYFITTLYYRMNKGQKIAVSISVPALLYIVLPILDYVFFKNNLFRAIGKFFVFVFSSPLSGMLLCLVLTVILTYISWLLIKKAVIKD